MPLPSPWVGLVLGLAAYRLTRLGGWDDWPPIATLRAWIIGERWVPVLDFHEYELSAATSQRLEHAGITQDDLPGKQPSSTLDAVRPAYDRPLLAHLFHCPFCLGWWISLAVYVWWVATPEWGLYPLVPFALSGFVGVVAKNLDA